MFNYITGYYGLGFYDINGVPIERTPSSHPYSYDEFVIYKSSEFSEDDSWAYSDRLLQWNGRAFRNAVKNVWPDTPESQMFFNKKPADINQFLNLYLKRNVKLTAIMQGCNAGNGYPYWIFAYKENV